MFFGTGTTSSVTQAAGAPAGGTRASPNTLVVLVKPANGYKLSRTHIDIRRDATEVVQVVKSP